MAFTHWDFSKSFCTNIGLFILFLSTLLQAQQVSPVDSGNRPAQRPRIGLALSGGGALGLTEIGVIQWMDENHIPVDRIAGTSMGAIIGAMYATGMSSQEMKRFAESGTFPESAAQSAKTGPFGDMPLAVLSHDPDKPSAEMPPDLAKAVNAEWEKMQEELAHLSTRGTQTIAKNSAHYIQSDRPDLVIDAVHRVVNEARTNPAPVRVAPDASSGVARKARNEE